MKRIDNMTTPWQRKSKRYAYLIGHITYDVTAHLLVWARMSALLGFTANLMPIPWHACFASVQTFVSWHKMSAPSESKSH